MGKSIPRGWTKNTSSGLYEYGVYDSSGNSRPVFDENGTLFSQGSAVNMGQGSTWYVDASAAHTTGDGKSWAQAFLTMAEAFAAIGSGDTIYFHGKVKEQISTPVEVFDVKVIGAGNRPRHIDGTVKAGSESAAMWTTPAIPVTTTPLCKVLQQGWRFENILFAGPSAAACVQVYTDAGSGDDERSGGHAEFINCRFASGQDGIEDSGGTGYCGVYNCLFQAMTGSAIKSTAGAGGTMGSWEVIGNRFEHCALAIKVLAFHWNIQYNTFMDITTGGVNLASGGTGESNVVMHNYFNVAQADWDNAAEFYGNATDVWGDNYTTDAVNQGVPGVS